MSESGPPVRRSSLKPAPADYKPSARDPSTMRPMAVVRAGEVPEGHPSTTQSQGGAAEPLPESQRAHLALSDNVPSDPSDDRVTPLSIPPPPGMPSGLTTATPSRPSMGATADNPTSSATESSASPGNGSADPSSRTALDQGSLKAAVASSPDIAPVTLHGRHYGKIAMGLACAGALAAVLGLLRGRDRHAPAVPSAPRNALSVPVVSLASTPAANSAPVDVNAVIPEPTPAPSASTTSTEAPQNSSATRVTLELMPIDAKVILRGREVPGPPFSFDVPHGKRVAIEVKRPGYITAKVVLDGKKPLVHFGMLKEGHR